MNLFQQSRSQRAPLAELVTSQLIAIIDSEQQLQHRYDRLQDAGSMDDCHALASELSSLRLRTDRLARMLDALDGTYVRQDWFEETTLNAA